MSQDINFPRDLHGISRDCELLSVSLKCDEWTYLFDTNGANVKILLDIAGLKSKTLV